MTLPFGPPIPVSPLVRGMRWTLLIAGIIYARGKQAIYSAQEEEYREEQAELKIIRDKEMKKMKAKIAAEEKETVRLFESGKLFEETSDEPDEDQFGKLPDGSPCRKYDDQVGRLPDGSPCRRY